jgi:hypothetical protein
MKPIEEEKITTNGEDPDWWICICKNKPDSEGFYPCDEYGNEIEPIIGSGWTNLYVCAKCKRIINASTHEVLILNT